MTSILVLHGPNLNLLGTREPEIYGHTTLSDIKETLTQQAQAASAELLAFQSNSESELIERIHQAGQDKTDFIIINLGSSTKLLSHSQANIFGQAGSVQPQVVFGNLK